MLDFSMEGPKKKFGTRIMQNGAREYGVFFVPLPADSNDMIMQQIGINYLECSGWTAYADGNLAFISETEHLSEMLGGDGIKTDFVLCIVCASGKLQVAVDGVSQTVCRHQALVCPINSMVTDYLCSPDFAAFAICASPSIFKDLYLNKQMWEYYQFVLRNHVVGFEDSDWSRFARYRDLMMENLGDTAMPDGQPPLKKFQDRIVRSLWQAVIYEFLSVVDRYVAHVQPSVDKSIGSERLRVGDGTSGMLLSSRFMEMLAMSEGRIHSVAEFATRLFVTPKYLSMSVKQTTGKTALAWIHEAVAKEAERLLTHSDQSIKEIANRLNSPNAGTLHETLVSLAAPPFFGKFVKQQLGDTPANIQNRQQ